MGAAFLLAALLAGALALAWMVAGRTRILFPLVLLYAALAYGVILTFVDGWAPFAGGGDDSGYFLASQVRLSGAGWFDFNQFPTFGQGGYPLMLAWVYQLTGASTYAYKAVNLFLYLLLAILWFRIGDEMGGRRAGWAFAISVLLGTPLWMYWMFILKDMTIVLLQSVFLLGAVRLAKGRGGLRTWVPIAVGTVLLIPFRVYLVILHAAVTVVTAVMAGRQSGRRKATLLTGAAVLLGGLMYLGGNQATLTAFGAGGDKRSLDYETVRGVSEAYADQRSKFSGPVGTVMFPLAYVFGETSGLRIGGTGGGAVSGDIQRPVVMVGGLSALPWIFFGSPLLFYAVWHMLRRPVRRLLRQDRPPGWAMRAPRAVILPAGGSSGWGREPGGTAVAVRPVVSAAAPAAVAPATVAAPAAESGVGGWLPLLVFLALYAVIAWLVEDTTRWRMPAFPVMTALAAQGWLWLRPRGRILIVGGWATSLAVLFTLYYGVLK